MREQSTSSLVIQIFMVESFCVPHNLVRTFFHRNFLFIVDLEHYYNGFGGFECSYSSQCLCEPIYLNAFFFFLLSFTVLLKQLNEVALHHHILKKLHQPRGKIISYIEFNSFFSTCFSSVIIFNLFEQFNFSLQQSPSFFFLTSYGK